MSKVYTTGEVAEITGVAPRTACKWIDTGALKGYRIPGSQDRRVPAEELYKFLKHNNMPIPLALRDNDLVSFEEWFKVNESLYPSREELALAAYNLGRRRIG